jgi:hypothetical protein
MTKKDNLDNYKIAREFEKQFNKFKFLRKNSLDVEYTIQAYTAWTDNELLIILPIDYIDYRELNLIFKLLHKYKAIVTHHLKNTDSFCIKIKRENAINIIKKQKKDENY